MWPSRGREKYAEKKIYDEIFGEIHDEIEEKYCSETFHQRTPNLRALIYVESCDKS